MRDSDSPHSPSREATVSKGTELLHIGEFARLVGASLRTLRYFEKLGLLKPVSRSRGGFRYYEHSQLHCMAVITRLQNLGLSLPEIAETIIRDGEAPETEVFASVQAALTRQIALTKTKIQTLKSDLKELEESNHRLVGMCASCQLPFSREYCDPCSHDHLPLPAMIRGLL